MATKANKIRAAARKRLANLSQKQIEAEQTRSDNRELLLNAQDRAMLEDMRARGFCAPKALPTARQYARYAAFRSSQAAANRAEIVEQETAVYAANGGVMDLVFERLRSPKLKDTAFAALAQLAQKGMQLAPVPVDDNHVTESPLPDEDELDAISDELGGIE